MVVVGITGRRHRAAAAVAIDGQVVAAITEASVSRVLHAGYGGNRVPERAVAACLEIAGVDAKRVDALVIADRTDSFSPVVAVAGEVGVEPCFPAAKKYRVGRLGAAARIAAASFDSPLILSADLDERRASCVALVNGALDASSLPDVDRIFALAPRVAAVLGATTDDPAATLTALERIARSEQSPAPASARRASDWSALLDSIQQKIAQATEQFGQALQDDSSPRVDVQRARAGIADSFLTSLAEAFALAVEDRVPQDRDGAATLTGSAFSDPDFNDRLQAQTSLRLRVAPAAIPEGAAVGAALAPFDIDRLGKWPDRMGLGPAFSESAAKVALENCRLDYVYEPRWPRLIERISRTLSTGKMVAWFQDSAEFGTSIGGSRSILCDASDRYAVDNINRFLRQQTADTPIGVSVPVEASGCVRPHLVAPWMMSPATVAPEARDRLRAAVAGEGRAHVHVVSPDGHPLFHQLLSAHWQRTGVPGLLNTPLHGIAEPVACSPRDAIRTMYSSSIDAMVIHRFLVMKDYWQMRSEDV